VLDIRFVRVHNRDIIRGVSIMSHPVNDQIIDSVIDFVANKTDGQVWKELKKRDIILHHSEDPRDTLMDIIAEEMFERPGPHG
tara:strand:+ start:18945 stop:19193 length:249 start_codon:yes stop_codon:yes gene_type:complete